MLKVIIGIENIEEYLTEEQIDDFIDCPTLRFNDCKKPEWFKNPMVREIIEKIDHSHVEMDFSVVNDETHIGYSVNDLCGGTKALILIKMMPNSIVLANMGENCLDFLERIALEYEERGQDLIIVDNTFHLFNFNYIKEVYYYNWDRVCHSKSEIIEDLMMTYIMEERKKREEEEEQEEYEDEDCE